MTRQALSAAGGNEQMLACPACGTVTLQAFLYDKNGCHILRCTQCGLGRAETGDFDPESYYTADYFSGGHDDGYADYLGAEPILRREFAGTVDFIRRFKPSGRLLDVGCAYGFFLQEAKRVLRGERHRTRRGCGRALPAHRPAGAVGRRRRGQA